MITTTRIITLSLATLCLSAAENEAWKRPYPAHQIIGNVYYVGTEDLACYLITDPKGHILINTGLADSAPLVKAGIEKMGFQLKDVKILLTMQAHYDHMAAMAEIKKETGAKMYSTPGDVAAIESGGKADPPGFDNAFPAVRVDHKLKDGEVIHLGSTALTVLFHPGHTKGSASFSMIVDGKSLLFANMGTVVMKLVDNPVYPNIVADYEHTFAAQKKLHPDIWVSAHGGQYGLLDLRKSSKTYAAGADFLPAVEKVEKAYREQLAKEQHP